MKRIRLFRFLQVLTTCTILTLWAPLVLSCADPAGESDNSFETCDPEDQGGEDTDGVDDTDGADDPEEAEDPDDTMSQEEIERGKIAGIWHLEEHISGAATLSSIAGVYWSARDLDSSPVGNHHFITIVYKSIEQAEKFLKNYGTGYSSFANEAGLIVHYTTFGVQTDDGTAGGSIIIDFNNASDVQAVKEAVNPDQYTNWYTADFDYEAHLMPFSLSEKGYISLNKLMEASVTASQNFNLHHSAGTRLPYSLVDTNCACIANSEFAALGFTSADRERLGEFDGIDWGEEDLVGTEYFDTIYEHR